VGASLRAFALAVAASTPAAAAQSGSVGVEGPSEVDLRRQLARPIEGDGADPAERPAAGEPAARAGAAFDVHLRVRETSALTLLVEPGEGVSLLDARVLGRSQGAAEVTRWTAPAPDHPAFRAGKGVLLSADPDRAGRAYAALPGGGLVALTAQPEGGRGYALTIDVALGPERLVLPRPEVAVERPAGDVLALPVPADMDAEVASVVGVRFERERGFGADEWEDLGATEPGAGLELAGVDPFAGLADGLALVRVRARYVDVHGRASSPGPASTLVRGASDPATREARITAAIEALVASEFQARFEARGVLLALQGEARPRLAGLEETLPDGAFALAVAEVLAEIDSDGEVGPSERRLRRVALGFVPASVDAAEAAGWLGDAPVGLAAPDALTRAHAALLALDRAQRGATVPGEDAEATVARAVAWARALADADPDPRVRALARFSIEAGVAPSAASFDPSAPAWLVPPAERSLDEPFAALAISRMPAAGDRLAFHLGGRPELADLDLGPILGRLVAALQGPPAPGALDDAVYDYDVRGADLLLRLVDRARASGPGVADELLRAAAALAPEPRDVLAALRATSDRRVAEPLRGARPEGRRVAELESADLGELCTVLASLDGAEWAGVDVLLPPGEYGAPSDDPDFVEVAAGGVRLLPRDPSGAPVVIHAGVRVSGGRDVVLERITVRHSAGQALTALGGAHVVVLDTELASRGKAVFAQDSDVELVDARLTTLEEGSAFAVLVQTVGRSRLLARASSLRGGSIYIGQGEGEVVLDRCVVDARERPVLQGHASARAVVRESLLVSEGMGVMSVAEGLLVASVIDAHRDPLGRGSSDLRLSPRLLLIVGSDQRAPTAQMLAREPFGPR